MVYNGEIYNYNELKTDLERSGVVFTSHSDTEVLFQLLIREGISALSKLNGFFAFAFYDRQLNRMYVVRDRFGVKPLLYYQDDDKLIFSSELPAIMKFDIDRSIDNIAINHYFSLSYIPAPATLFQRVRSVVPGCYLEISENEVKSCSYYRIAKCEIDSTLDYQHAKNKIKDLVHQSVEMRLVSDVPLGCFLSGGLDSSVVASVAREHKSDIESFSIGFDHAFFDETSYAEEVARHIGSRHETFKLTQKDFSDNFLPFLNSVTEPFGDSSSFASYLLSRETRKHVVVCLSGDGADELFGGYRKYQAELRLRNLRGVKAGAIKLASKIFSSSRTDRHSSFGDFNRKLQKFRNGMRMPDQVRYWNWCCFIDDDDRQGLLKNPVFQGLNLFLNNEMTSMNDVFLADQQLVLPNDMLKKVDMTSMAHALEVRTPFLDFQLVEFANSLPEEFKMNLKTGKKILRDAFSDSLPHSIVNRKKSGFEIPLRLWLEPQIIAEFSKPEWSREYLDAQGLFRYDFVEKLKQDWSQPGFGDRIYLVWSLLVFQHWWHKYMMPS